MNVLKKRNEHIHCCNIDVTVSIKINQHHPRKIFYVINEQCNLVQIKLFWNIKRIKLDNENSCGMFFHAYDITKELLPYIFILILSVSYLFITKEYIRDNLVRSWEKLERFLIFNNKHISLNMSYIYQFMKYCLIYSEIYEHSIVGVLLNNPHTQLRWKWK